MNNKLKKFLIVVGIIFCTAAIIFITCKEGVFKTKQKILLKAMPVNVMDLLKKEDYVDLQYNISSIRLQNVNIMGDNFITGKEIYVCIEVKEDGYATATDIYSTPPSGKPFIKGILKGTSNNSFDIDYGMGKCFIPKDIDFSEDMSVEIIIDKSGNATIKTLLIGEKEIKQNDN